MFAKPRPKKSPLPPPNKKRKTSSAIEEISFDFDARQEYLTGFHKRKLQRVKHAQEEAAKRARLEKLEARKQIRQDRQRDVEQHVETVNRMLRESDAATSTLEQTSPEESTDEWEGLPDRPDLELVDHEEEYVDEDRYTTVTVESVLVSRDGLAKTQIAGDAAQQDDAGERSIVNKDISKKDETKPTRPEKKKKKKFRYETKLERQITDRKQRAGARSRGPG